MNVQIALLTKLPTKLALVQNWNQYFHENEKMTDWQNDRLNAQVFATNLSVVNHGAVCF